MVAQHYRWDFYGLSTDSKPDATNPKVADGSTYYEADTSKLYVWYKDQWYEKQSTGGGGGASIARVLTEDDMEDGKFKLWKLDSGIYIIPHMENTLVYVTSSDDYWTADQIAIVSKNSTMPSGNGQIIFMDYSQGSYIFAVSFLNGSRISKGKIATQ